MHKIFLPLPSLFGAAKYGGRPARRFRRPGLSEEKNLFQLLTDFFFYDKIASVAGMQCATVAQPVEQLTRNEQVVRSNRISSSRKNRTTTSGEGVWCGFFIRALGMGCDVQESVWATLPET